MKKSQFLGLLHDVVTRCSEIEGGATNQTIKAVVINILNIFNPKVEDPIWDEVLEPIIAAVMALYSDNLCMTLNSLRATEAAWEAFCGSPKKAEGS